MDNNVSVVTLPGKHNFAVIYPRGILFGLNATQNELETLVEEATEAASQPNADYEFVAEYAELSMIPTFDCTLACKYCYARGGEAKDIMPLETALSAMTNLRSNGSKLKLNLVGGGEPLMHTERVREIVLAAHEIYSEVDIGVVTNGTFNGAALPWLIENNVRVRLSFDGVMHKYQRPFPDGSDSTKLVLENLKATVFSGLDPIVQCIITSKGISTMRDTVGLLVEYGVRTVKFEPALATDVSRATQEMEPDPKRYAEQLIDTIKYVAENDYDITIDTGYFSEPSTDYYCGMPTGNKILTPRGLITSCVEVSRQTDPYSSQVMVGKVSRGSVKFNEEALKLLSTLHYNNQKGGCKSCNLRLICHGGCPMANIWRGGFPLRKSAYTCAVEHSLVPPLLLMLATNDRIAKVIMEDPSIDRF